MKKEKNISISILDVEEENLEKFLIDLRKIVDKNNFKNISIHFDVMDGIFVKNLGIDLNKIALVKKYNFFTDVHLMVANPEKYIEEAFKAGANIITVHSEIKNIDEVMYKLYSLKILESSKDFYIGLAISPDTDVNKVFKYNNLIDVCLVMTVYPGYGSQQFLDSSINKIKSFKNEFKILEVDGGINKDTIKVANDAGANTFVIGSYFTKNIEELEERLITIQELLK